MKALTKSFLNDLTYQINGACIDVHKALGPGLLEGVYHKCLIHEFGLRKIRFASEMAVPLSYKGENLTTELRCDFLVEDAIILELKAVKAIEPVFEAQVMTYMNLLKKPKGILVNFNVKSLYQEGQRTFVNEYFRSLPE